MESIKYKIEILKFKITIFSTMLGGAIFLLINKEKLLLYFSEFFLLIIVALLLFYGTVGFISNLYQLNKIYKDLS